MTTHENGDGMQTGERISDSSLVELDRLRYGRLFPWVHLARAFRIAVDFRKMLLGGIALVVLAAGHWGLSYLPIAPEADAPALRQWPWDVGRPWGVLPLEHSTQVMQPQFLTDRLVRQVRDWPLVLAPLRSVAEPGMMLMQPGVDWPTAMLAWSMLLWALAVWSFFGTALARMAAVQFARDEKMSLRQALKFAASRCVWVFSAPLLPLGFLAATWVSLFLAGWMGSLPVVGPALLGLLWVLVLVCGLAMVLLLLGLVAGWPLMVVTVAAQGSDGFDGFSRSFDYVFSRPWYYLWSAVLTVAYGVVSFVFVTWVAALVVSISSWPVANGLGNESLTALPAVAPALFSGSSPVVDSLGAFGVSAWLHGLALLVVGFVPSFFWAAATIVYFLLRQSTDANKLDEVWMPTEDETDAELVRLAGVAASEQPIVERPVHADETA